MPGTDKSISYIDLQSSHCVTAVDAKDAKKTVHLIENIQFYLNVVSATKSPGAFERHQTLGTKAGFRGCDSKIFEWQELGSKWTFPSARCH